MPRSPVTKFISASRGRCCGLLWTVSCRNRVVGGFITFRGGVRPQVVLPVEDPGGRSADVLLQSSYLSVCCELSENVSLNKPMENLTQLSSCDLECHPKNLQKWALQ